MPALTEPHYPIEPPDYGKLREVIPGLMWLRVPLPFERLNHLNVWILDEGDSWAVMDCGMNTPDTIAIWQELLAGPLAAKPIRVLIATHCHGDHIGYARRLCAMTGARFVSTRAEWFSAVQRRVETNRGMRAEAHEFYGRNGVPESDIATILNERDAMGARVDPPPESYHRIANGHSVRFGGRDWQVSTSGGHALEHPIFQSPGLALMIAGDQLLPRISPHIGIQMHEPLENPLGEYFAHLDSLSETSDDILVLPSHERPYFGVSGRIAQLRAHHENRLDRIVKAAGGGRTVYEISKIVFHAAVCRGQVRHAFSETLAHVNYLLAEGQILKETGKDGFHRYACPRAATNASCAPFRTASAAPPLEARAGNSLIGPAGKRRNL